MLEAGQEPLTQVFFFPLDKKGKPSKQTKLVLGNLLTLYVLIVFKTLSEVLQYFLKQVSINFKAFKKYMNTN